MILSPILTRREVAVFQQMKKVGETCNEQNYLKTGHISQCFKPRCCLCTPNSHHFASSLPLLWLACFSFGRHFWKRGFIDSKPQSKGEVCPVLAEFHNFIIFFFLRWLINDLSSACPVPRLLSATSCAPAAATTSVVFTRGAPQGYIKEEKHRKGVPDIYELVILGLEKFEGHICTTSAGSLFPR